MTIPFRDYLDIKSALDGHSLNAQVYSAFLEALRGRERLDCLDIGVGTGASLWRLLNANLSADLNVTAVGRDAELLGLAFRRTLVLLRARGYAVETPGDTDLRAQRGACRVAIDFVAADLRDLDPGGEAGRFDAVIAQQALELLPLAGVAGRVGHWLKPRGMFYAPLNYDGGTSLFPGYQEREVEERILAAYDAAVERRQVWDREGGGVRAGQRLYEALADRGFEPVAYGSSDWSLTPVRRAYRDREQLCLVELLKAIRDEAAGADGLAGETVGGWYVDRLRDIGRGRLGLVVHRLDVLAQKV